MCSGFVLLMMSISAASVVDFPLPVGPVTNTSPRQVGELAHRPGHAELLEGKDLEGDATEDGADGVALLEDVQAEPADGRDDMGGVELQVGLEPLPELLRQDLVDQVTYRRGRQHVEPLHREEVTVDTRHGRATGSQVEVRTPGLDHLDQDLVHVQMGGFGPSGQGRPGRAGTRAITGRQCRRHVGAASQTGPCLPARRLGDHRHRPIVERVVGRHEEGIPLDAHSHDHVFDGQLGRDHPFDER